MASVYRAYEATLDRYVAVKVLPAEFLHDPTFAERFQREAKVIARLEHPNIIPIYAYGIDEEQRIPWMAMRLVPGGALSAIVRGSGRRLPFERSIAILRGVAEALDYAHAKGVVHRDVKPQNILLDEAERVYLADFGIAKMVESSAGLTQTGMISGTPQYMAPEQATAATVDHRADIYALGIVAFEMFTGRVPFVADTPVAILMKHVSEAMPLPSTAEVPEALMRPVLKSTSKRAEDRWPTASAFVRALEQGLGEAAAAGTAARPEPTTHMPARTAGATAPAVVPTIESQPTQPRAAATYTPPLAPTRPPAPPTVAARPPARPQPRPAPSGSNASLIVVGLVAFLLVVGGGGAVLIWLVTRQPDPTPIVEVTPTPRPTWSPEPTPLPSPTGVAPTPTPIPATPEPVVPSPTLPPTTRPSPRPSPLPTATAVPTPFPTVRPTPIPTTAPTATPRSEPAVPADVRALMTVMERSGSADERWRAAETLGNYGREARGAVPVLVAALRDRNDQVRWRSAEALGKIGPDAAEAVPALADALDRSDLLSQEAAKALGRMGAAARPAVNALASALTRSDVYLRREAAKALVKLGPEAAGAVPTLIEALGDKDRTVRAEACKVLGRIGPGARDALPALQAATKDREELVRTQASEAVKRIGGS
jgi:serine/threonine-protein kinase